MKKIRIIIPTFFLSLIVIPFILYFVDKHSNQQEIPQLDIKFLKLNNKIPVIFIPNKKVPAILNMIWFNVGGVDEPKNKTGIAHFFEHIIFHNTINYDKGEYDAFLESIGGSNNAFTSFDYTSYFSIFPKEYFSKILDFEFDRLNNLIFDPDLIENEKKIILEERLLRKENNPGQELMINTKKVLFGAQNPYSRPLIGYEDDIKNITLDDLKEFKLNHYNSDKIFFVISGDITEDELLKILNEKFTQYFVENQQKTPQNINIQKQVFPEIKDQDKIIIKKSHKIDSYNVNWVYRINNFYEQKEKNRYALIVLNKMLSDLPNSLLTQNFVIDNQIAINAATSNASLSRLGGNYFAISFSLKEKEKLPLLYNNMKLLLQNLKLGRFNNELFETAKQNLISNSIYDKESFKSLGFNIGFAYASGLKQKDIVNWEKNIQAVKYRDIIQVANKIFIKENLVRSYLIPENDNDFINLIND
ncbi:MAG: insulinase family protein [Rickettsiales bacterium]|nr:insulinase family protein [Rickettsiales bacterium]